MVKDDEIKYPNSKFKNTLSFSEAQDLSNDAFLASKLPKLS
jgi:hypothetical protein